MKGLLTLTRPGISTNTPFLKFQDIIVRVPLLIKIVTSLFNLKGHDPCILINLKTMTDSVSRNHPCRSKIGLLLVTRPV